MNKKKNMRQQGLLIIKVKQ